MPCNFEKLCAMTDPDDIVKFVTLVAKGELAIPDDPDHERAFGFGYVAAALAQTLPSVSMSNLHGGNVMKVTIENLEAVLADLENLAGELPAKDRSFANSLIDQGKKRTLSEKQMFWVGKLLDTAVHGPAPPPTANIDGGFAGLIKLFATAKEHMKYPKITVHYGEATYRLALAGPMAKKPGWITLTDGEPYGFSKWFGRISPEGDWDLPYTIKDADKSRLTRLLMAFSLDAAAAATKYGKLSGNCCFCNTAIGEGDDDTSVKLGYGPVCSKNFGLPWGKKAVAALDNKESEG